MSMFATGPVENSVEQMKKRIRFNFTGASGANMSQSMPTVESTTAVVPYQDTNWTHMIEPQSCVFYLRPDTNSDFGAAANPLKQFKYLFMLTHVNLLLHQYSLTQTIFQSDGMAKAQPRLPELEDIECLFRYRGVNQTSKSEGEMLGQLSVERDVVSHFRGQNFVFNYWGNVRANSNVYFVLKKVKIDSTTEYVLGDTTAVPENNLVREGDTGRMYVDPETGKNVEKKMVFRLVPMYPGCPHELDPKGRGMNDAPFGVDAVSNTLSTKELSYDDLDDLDNNGKPIRKLGVPIPVGIVIVNKGNSDERSNPEHLTRCAISLPYVVRQPRLEIYSYAHTY